MVVTKRISLQTKGVCDIIGTNRHQDVLNTNQP